MPRIALATCAKFPDLYEGDRQYLPALDRAGIAWQPTVWTDPSVDWRSFDAVVIRTTWDYFERYPEFRRWLTRLRDERVRVLNPLATLEMNCDKLYLRELAARGVPTVPTCWIAPGTPPDEVRRALRELRWPELVVKPSVSGGAFRTERVSREALLARPDPLVEILADSHALVQPFLPEIGAGEWSFLFFGGEFSHAVLKKPQEGDYRVQFQYGGTHHTLPFPAGVLEQATAALRACRELPGGDGEQLYARVDGVVHDGTFVVVEIELIEPHLFLDQDPAAPARFVAALEKLLR